MRTRTGWYVLFALFWWDCFFTIWCFTAAVVRESLMYGAFGLVLMCLAIWTFTNIVNSTDVRNLGLIQAFKVGLAEARYGDIQWLMITYNIERIELELWNPVFYFRDTGDEPFPLSSLDHNGKMYKDARKMFGYIR